MTPGKYLVLPRKVMADERDKFVSLMVMLSRIVIKLT